MEKWELSVKELEKKRESLGITYYALGKLIGMNPQQLKRILNLENCPTLMSYYKIHDALFLSSIEVIEPKVLKSEKKPLEPKKEANKWDCGCTKDKLFVRAKGCSKPLQEHK